MEAEVYLHFYYGLQNGQTKYMLKNKQTSKKDDYPTHLKVIFDLQLTFNKYIQMIFKKSAEETRPSQKTREHYLGIGQEHTKLHPICHGIQFSTDNLQQTAGQNETHLPLVTAR